MVWLVMLAKMLARAVEASFHRGDTRGKNFGNLGMAAAFLDQRVSVLTGGSDNHLLLVDVAESFGLTGRQAESALRECGITLNRNSLPDGQYE